MLALTCLSCLRKRGVARALAVSLVLAASVACDEDEDKSAAHFAGPVIVDAAADSSAPDSSSAATDAGNAQVPWDAQAASGGDAAIGADASAIKPSDAGLGADAMGALMDAGTLGADAGPDGATADGAAGADGALADAASDGATSDAATSDAATSDAATGDAGPSLPAAQPRSVRVGTLDRTFLLYVPKSIDPTKPAPLVSVHHGFTMSGKIMEEISTWKNIAERERIVVAFPDGGDFLGPWNVGENVCNIGQVVSGSSEQDDLGFVKAIIDSANTVQPINRAAVFVGGFSMGGYFANHAGCQGRDFLRAVSAHSGGTYMGTCPGNPLPVLLIHGDADGLIDYECATLARGYWIERNGCTSQVVSEAIKGGSCDWNQGCPAGRELGLCTMKGMDHGWAGAPTSGPGAWLTAPIDGNIGYGGGVQYEDAAELMWRFFKKYL